MGRDGKMDVHLGVCHDGYVGRLDVIEGPSGRRQRSDEDKARIVAERLTAGVRVAAVARRHGLTRWPVYDDRKRVVQGKSVSVRGVLGGRRVYHRQWKTSYIRE